MSEINQWYVIATINNQLHVLVESPTGWLDYVLFDDQAIPWLFNSLDLAKAWCMTPEWDETVCPVLMRKYS